MVIFTVRKGCVRMNIAFCDIEGRSMHCALLYKMYHRADHPMHDYLYYFIATCNTRASAALGELALVITCCKTDQFNRSFLPASVRLWNLLPSGEFSGGTLDSFKITVNLGLQRA